MSLTLYQQNKYYKIRKRKVACRRRQTFNFHALFLERCKSQKLRKFHPTRKPRGFESCAQYRILN